MPEAARAPAPAPAPSPAPAPRRSSTTEPAQLSPRPLGSPPAGLPPAVGRLLAAPGPGEQLPTSVRGPISERLGVDANAVRVHTGDDAAVATASIQARAFAYGTHIFLGPGQKPTDLGLMAHEVAHVVQQSGGATIQRSTMSGAADGLELEARSAGAAVARGERTTVLGRTGGARIQGSILGSIVGGIRAVGSAIADLGRAAWDAALNFVKGKAKLVPGYDLLSFILGRDPITQDPVERNAINLVRGLVGLIPGGAAIFENIQKAGVLQKIADWFGTEVEKLNLSWATIRGLFGQAWDALSVSDVLSPSTAWEKIKRIFGPPIRRLVDFAIAAGKKLLEFVFEGAIALGGSAAQQVLGFFRRTQSVFALIVGDPVRFLSNLVAAAKGGFEKFRANIVEHLKKALFNWLFGALASAIRLPAKFDLMGIVDTVLQVLGLTYERFRERLVRVLGESAVGYLETAFDFLKTLVTKGIAAAWEKLLEFASGLVDTVVSMIRDYIVKTIVGKAVVKLVSMFNPVGAIIQSIIAIYDTVMFFIEKAKEVAVFVAAIVDSIENIAKGNIAGAIAFIERMLASALVLIINFLARFAGLSKIASAIKDTIKKVADTVWKAIDKAVDWVRDKVKDLLGKKEGAETPGKPPLLPEKQFDEAGEHHKLYLKVDGHAAEPMIASTPMALLEFLKKLEDAGVAPAEKATIKAARDKVGEMKGLASKLVDADPKDATLDTQRTKLQALESELAPLLQTLLSDVGLSAFNEIYLLEGVTGPYAQMPTQRRDLMTPDHQPQASILEYAAENVMVAPSGPGSKTSVFAGLPLERAATGHGSGGMTINLHHFRHRAGRTYGGKSASILANVRPKLDAISLRPADTPAQKRAAVVRIFRSELKDDVDKMLEVAGQADTQPVWQDIVDLNLRGKKTASMAKVRAQIKAGEQAMLGQNLDRFK